MVLQDGLGAIAGEGVDINNLGQQEANETTGVQQTQQEGSEDVKDTDVLNNEGKSEDEKTLSQEIYDDEVKASRVDERVNELEAIADEILGGDGKVEKEEEKETEESEPETKEQVKEDVQEKIDEAEEQKDDQSKLTKMKEAMETLALEYHAEKTELTIANKKLQRENKSLNKALEEAHEELDQYKMNPKFIKADDKTAAFDITWKAYNENRDNKRARDNLARLGMSIISTVYPEFDAVAAIQDAKRKETSALTGMNNVGGNPQGLVKQIQKPKYQMGFPAKGR